MDDEPTDETRLLAASLLDALREWDPRILEPTRSNLHPPHPEGDRERWFPAHLLQRHLSDDADDSARAWKGPLHRYEPESRVPGGARDAVHAPTDRLTVEAGFRRELRALAVEDERVNPGTLGG